MFAKNTQIKFVFELTTNPMEATENSQTAIAPISIDWPRVTMVAPHAIKRLLITGEQA